MSATHGFNPRTEITPVTIRRGKAITVKSDTVIWLPKDVRTVRLLLLARSGDCPKFGPEPDLAVD